MATIDKLIVALGFEFDPKELDQFKKSMGNVGKVVKSIGTAVAGATAALFGLTAATTSATDEQGKMANQIGINVSDLDAYQYAAQLAGDSAQGMSESLKQLSIRASESARGMGSGVEAFGILGISITDANGQLKNTGQLFKEVSGAMRGMDKAKQIELAEKLGLSSAIRLLQAGPSAIKEMTDEAYALGVTTEEDARISAEFQDAMVRMKKIILQVSKAISSTFAPVVLRITKQVADWWKKTKDLLDSRFPEWVDKGVRALKMLAVAAGVFIAAELLMSVNSLIKGFKGLTTVVSIFNKTVVLLPALLLALGIALIGFAQDAKTYFEGGDSYLGDLIARFPEWKNAIETVGAALATFWDLLMMALDGWKQLIDLIFNTSWEDLKEGFALLPGFLWDSIKQMMAVFVEFGKFLETTIKNAVAGIFDPIVTALENLFDSMVEKISGMIDAVKEKIPGAKLFGKIKGFFGGDEKKTVTTEVLTEVMPPENMADIKAMVANNQDISSGENGINLAGLNRLLDNQTPISSPQITPETIAGGMVPGAGTTTNRNTTNNKNVHIAAININGAQDPAAVADELNRQLEQATKDIGTAVYQ